MNLFQVWHTLKIDYAKKKKEILAISPLKSVLSSLTATQQCFKTSIASFTWVLICLFSDANAKMVVVCIKEKIRVRIGLGKSNKLIISQ
jgi:hypothetical protein